MILAMFPKCTQEPEVLFLLGNFIQMVDKHVIYKPKEFRVDSMLGGIEDQLQCVKY